MGPIYASEHKGPFPARTEALRQLWQASASYRASNPNPNPSPINPIPNLDADPSPSPSPSPNQASYRAALRDPLRVDAEYEEDQVTPSG